MSTPPIRPAQNTHIQYTTPSQTQNNRQFTPTAPQQAPQPINPPQAHIPVLTQEQLNQQMAMFSLITS